MLLCGTFTFAPLPLHLWVQEGLTIQANGRWQQIKLLRAEWAHPRTIPGLYSRVLYITNLTPVSQIPSYCSYLHAKGNHTCLMYVPVAVTQFLWQHAWASDTCT